MSQLTIAGVASLLLVGCTSTAGPQPVAAAPTGFQEANPCEGVEAVSRLPAYYPRAAFVSKQDGWVALTYDITKVGETTNVKVVSSSPAGLFDNVAITALSGWQFPVSELNYAACHQLLNYKLAPPHKE